MTQLALVNGQFLSESKATVSIFNRGFLFADGVYEFISVLDGKLIDTEPHFQRLENSLSALQIKWPQERTSLEADITALVSKNNLQEGYVYFQVTRGASQPRAFNFPPENTQSTIIAFTQELALIDRPEVKKGVRVISVPDIRWQKRDVKSISLLPQCLGKQAAVQANAYEAIMVEDNVITEGTSSTFYIVKDNVLITRPLSQKILPGVTRRAILELAKKASIEIEEREFTLEEAYAADEACVTAASNFIMPVIDFDGHQIGNGKPGPIVKQLRGIYVEIARAS